MNEVINVPVDQVQESSGPRKVVEERVKGDVKWFNVKSGYGFIHRLDTDTDVFVHHSGISRNQSGPFQGSLREGEEVEFYVVEGEKGEEAHEVTGPNGAPVQGSMYPAPRGRGQMYMRGGRGFDGYGMTFYGRGRDRGGPGGYGDYGFMDRGGRGRPYRGRPSSRPFYPRRGRGGYRGGGGSRGENGDSGDHHEQEHQHPHGQEEE